MKRALLVVLAGVLVVIVARHMTELPTDCEVVIVGGGPAGLQWALELESAHIKSYVVLEKSKTCGAFFKKCPWNRRLISVNKRVAHRSREFQLRHDWHSLLGTRLRMSDFSKEYYPHADDFCRYLDCVSRTLKVRRSVNVTSVEYGADSHVVHTSRGKIRCRHVVIATGYSMRPPPAHYTRLFPKTPILSYDKLPPPMRFKDKTVIVLGNGNAALEVANLSSQYTYRTIVLGNSPRLSAVTHYPGNVRIKNLAIYDQYLLKSLDIVNLDSTFIEDANMYQRERPDFRWDYIIFCGGFTTASNLVEIRDRNDKFPRMRPFFEHEMHDNVWYAGCIMHRFDFKKSAGGFVHGFRYLIRSQVRFMLHTRMGRRWPYKRFDAIDDMRTHILSRIRDSSGLYQMQAELCDVFTPKDLLYWEEIPHRWVGMMIPNATFVTLSFEYGSKWSSFETVFSKKRFDGETPQFLHPVLRICENNEISKTFHLEEDVLAEWRFADFEIHLRSTLHQIAASVL